MNKKVFVIMAIMIFYSIPIRAQLIKSLGVKGGLSYASQDWKSMDQPNYFDEIKLRQGYDIAFYAEWFNQPLVSLLTEIHYIQKGTKWKINIPITTVQFPDGTGQFLSVSGETWADYLSIPLLAKVQYDLEGYSTYLVVGPRFDYFINNHTGSVLENFSKWDFGGTIGIGFETNSISSFIFGAEFRYSPNFQNSLSTPYVTAKNNSMEILLVVGY